MENPIKMDDLGVPLFLETPRCFQEMFFLGDLTMLSQDPNFRVLNQATQLFFCLN